MGCGNGEKGESTNSSNEKKDETVQSSEQQETDTEPEEFVIDVRSKEEWDTGHLDQAVLIPHTEISDRIGEVTEDKSAKIVVY